MKCISSLIFHNPGPTLNKMHSFAREWTVRKLTSRVVSIAEFSAEICCIEIVMRIRYLQI